MLITYNSAWIWSKYQSGLEQGRDSKNNFLKLSMFDNSNFAPTERYSGIYQNESESDIKIRFSQMKDQRIELLDKSMKKFSHLETKQKILNSEFKSNGVFLKIHNLHVIQVFLQFHISFIRISRLIPSNY